MLFPYLITPWIPTNCDLPPTLLSLMNSICNFGAETKTNTYNLAKGSRSTIFDFEYPLSSHVDKEDFEVMILNHYIHRRIGFETPTEFKIALNVKLNEIMPKYNKLFDVLDGWNILTDGEVTTRSQSISGNNTVSVMNTNTSDRRNSNVPQNELADIQSGNYMTDYNYDTNTDTGTTASNVSNSLMETISRSPSDKIKIYKEFMKDVDSIYTMIFKELDSLFYGLV